VPPFLYIDPIKQGLKQEISSDIDLSKLIVFIHRSNKTRIETPIDAFHIFHKPAVFIHRSNKTRIETFLSFFFFSLSFLFLYIDPIKQGLKPRG